MEDACGRTGIEERDELRRKITGVRRLADLIGHHRYGLAFLLELEHGLDEVAALQPIKPRGADDVRARRQLGEHCFLAGQLGAPVGRARIARSRLGIRRGGITGEYVVGGDLHEPGIRHHALGSEHARAFCIHAQREFFLGLGIIDSRPGSAVDDDIGREGIKYRGDGDRVGDVDFREIDTKHRVSGAGRQKCHECTAQLAIGPGDDDAHC